MDADRSEKAPPTCGAANFIPGVYCHEPKGHDGPHQGVVMEPRPVAWDNDPPIEGPDLFGSSRASDRVQREQP